MSISKTFRLFISSTIMIGDLYYFTTNTKKATEFDEIVDRHIKKLSNI